jgi:hypothetical protein
LFSTGLWKLFPDKYFVVNSLHPPAGDRVERGGSHGFSGVEAETGMMQGTTQSVSDNQALRKRSVVVRTVCTDRKKRLAPAHQDDIFATCLTNGDAAVGKIAN